MNELVKSEKQDYAARYRSDNTDPIAQFANEGGPGIQGKLLTCKKGSWGIGTDGDPVPVGTLYLLIVPTMMRGMLKWQGGIVVDAVMGLVTDGFMVPHRHTLGDLDESQWEKGPDGQRDPWAPCYRVLLIELAAPHGDLTFSGGSYGAKLACQAICQAYIAEPHGPDTYPVVELGTKSRVSQAYGKIVGPWFEVKGWATVEDVKTGRKSGAATLAKPAPVAKAKAKPKAKPSKRAADEPAPWDRPDV